MSSTLILVNVEKLHEETKNIIKEKNNNPLIYISINKDHESVKKFLTENKIDISNIFFVDCLMNEPKSDDVIILHPQELDKLNLVIIQFIKEIPGKKELIIDDVSTLLIYNKENEVAKFIQNITEYASKKEVEFIALSPKTQEEEFLDKIFNFFDQVKKK